MLRVYIYNILCVYTIFWCIYTPSEDSPNYLIMKYLGLDYKPTKFTHLIIGTVFYILGVLIAQQQSIQHFWF